MKIADVDINKVSPMMRQYMEIKQNNPDIIIMFRLGDFYEMFFEDAINVSKELELTLTGKNAGLDERIPMCGIPYHAINMYLEKLVENGHKVGICEQLEDPKEAKGVVKRGLTKIVSRGTIIDESLLETENNYIGALIDFEHIYALSYIDLSTGEVNVTLVNHDISSIISEIVNIGIKELIMNDKCDINIKNLLMEHYKIDVSIINEYKSLPDYKYVYEDIEDIRYIKAIEYLINYLLKLEMQDLSHLMKANVIKNNDYLKMDIHTKRNLELTETLRLKQRQYSLLWLMDRTKTAPGARMLKNYIENPLIREDEINKRLDIVDKLIKEFILKSDLRDALDGVYDIERLTGRIALGSASARDLLQLKNSLKNLPIILEILKKINYYTLFEIPYDLYDLLEKSINEDAPTTLKEGSLIKEGYSIELDELKSIRKNGKDFIAQFENDERERTGIKNLKVGYNRVFGYYIEVSKGSLDLVKDEYGYERKQTLAGAERYISKVLKEKEDLILNAEEKIIKLEYDMFIEIRNKVKEYIVKLQAIAHIISEIDVLQSFATITEENNYVRPTFSHNNEVNIIENRHPVIEKVINNYVKNDIKFDKNTNILLITGPNMAGKSTYMRQFAITVIMAQMGSFVPADEAFLPIFDKIFTRIGASDDLVSGESTFMVEMNEANMAIKKATENSLILFDELGRGTATFDGMALAQSIIEYIHDNIKCKTLFSTHYHELTDLENNLKHLKNIHVSAHLEDGNITFLHKIEEGSIDKSYGIHVARLAGLPDNLIKRADQILNVYENKERKRDIKIQEALPLDDLVQKESPVEEELKKIDPMNTTPMDALNILYKLKEMVK
ncbi:dNA mismatch repair protein MutS [Firmicutes bacterium CAG:884]|nr:dNA mismatch repair protein MutS [Firmicutes bacterium CAG:884]